MPSDASDAAAGPTQRNQLKIEDRSHAGKAASGHSADSERGDMPR